MCKGLAASCLSSRRTLHTCSAAYLVPTPALLHIISQLVQAYQCAYDVLSTAALYVLSSCDRHAIYYGDAQLATEWFHKLGYTLPYQINAADFILDLASGDVSTQKVSGAESRQHLIACAETFLLVGACLLLPFDTAPMGSTKLHCCIGMGGAQHTK